MATIKSGVSFFRKQLRIKGRSEHNGRGRYEMDFDCTVAELDARIQQMIKTNPDMFTIDYEYGFTVTIKREYCDNYYRALQFNPDAAWCALSVVMAWDSLVNS